MFAPVDGGCCREARTQRQAPHAGTSAYRTLLERRLCRNSGAPKPAGNLPKFRHGSRRPLHLCLRSCGNADNGSSEMPHLSRTGAWSCP